MRNEGLLVRSWNNFTTQRSKKDHPKKSQRELSIHLSIPTDAIHLSNCESNTLERVPVCSHKDFPICVLQLIHSIGTWWYKFRVHPLRVPTFSISRWCFFVLRGRLRSPTLETKPNPPNPGNETVKDSPGRQINSFSSNDKVYYEVFLVEVGWKWGVFFGGISLPP